MRHACFDVVITIKIAKYVKEQQHKRMTTTNIEPCTKLLFSKALQNQKSINEFTKQYKILKKEKNRTMKGATIAITLLAAILPQTLSFGVGSIRQTQHQV